MSDQEIAYIGRQLAVTLRAYARERRDDFRKEIARLQTELCQKVRDELPEESRHD